MAVDKSVIGKTTGSSKVVVERGPLSIFARSVKDENPIYHDLNAAKAAGFDDIPAPPTFAFSGLTFWVLEWLLAWVRPVGEEVVLTAVVAR